MSAHPSPTPARGPSPLERDLASLSAGQRNFFRLVLGVTRALFVLLWPLLWGAWFLRRFGTALRGGAWPVVLPAGPTEADPPPDWTLLEVPGCPLYVVGAAVALALGVVSTIAMCFWPLIAGLWVFQALPDAAARGGGALAGVALGALGAAALEAVMLTIYTRYVRGGLAGR
ncbi:hypothetical protein [Deinococcus planocerae]|uniref:hypothetical protein n=1 Tax=Deinococcus planocerae TaxID=1737569 RepID=UPI000C7F77B1|nr:hypothetical protein [Deinococcus planocerae]